MRVRAGIGLLLALGVSTLATGQEAQRPATVTLTTAQAESLIREVSATVEQLRHLRFKTPVAVEVVDGATARRDFESDLDDAAREEARHTRDTWVHLGLVPAATDLVKSQLDLAETDVLGYYHSGSKTFRLLSHVPQLEIRSVMAHELTHALEDQYYDLAAVQKRATNEDQAVAIRAVIEGSAMVSTLGMMQRQGGIGKAKEEAARTGEARAKTVEGAPTFVQMRLMLPYTLGFSFLLRGKPWEWLFDGVRVQDIEQAYKQPPYSTHEILHPEQYWGGHRENLRPLTMPDMSKLLGPGWTRAAFGSIGELGLTLMTGSHREDRRLRGAPAHALDNGGRLGQRRRRLPPLRERRAQGHRVPDALGEPARRRRVPEGAARQKRDALPRRRQHRHPGRRLRRQGAAARSRGGARAQVLGGRLSCAAAPGRARASLGR